jgi:hypothetical protein
MFLLGWTPSWLLDTLLTLVRHSCSHLTGHRTLTEFDRSLATDKKFKFLMFASKAVIKKPAKYGLSTLLKLFAALTAVLAVFRGRSKL